MFRFQDAQLFLDPYSGLADDCESIEEVLYKFSSVILIIEGRKKEKKKNIKNLGEEED